MRRNTANANREKIPRGIMKMMSSLILGCVGSFSIPHSIHVNPDQAKKAMIMGRTWPMGFLRPSIIAAKQQIDTRNEKAAMMATA